MAIIATVTISTVDYSVYGLTADAVNDADEYFIGRLGAAVWTAADADLKKQALVTAFRMMNRRPTWSGTVTVEGQDGAWPRDDASCGDEAVTDGTIPDLIALGQFELALSLLESEAIQDAPGSGSNIKRVGAGPASVEFFSPTVNTSSDLLFPQVVNELISCYFAGSAGIAPIVTGTSEESSFDDEDYDLIEGYP